MTSPALCDCELRNRRWNPNTGRCESCRRRYREEPAPLAQERAVLFTNLHLVWIGPVRTNCAALVLERSTRGGPEHRLRGFGYSAAWPVFDLTVPAIEYTIEYAESDGARVMNTDGTTRPLLLGGVLHIKGRADATDPISFDLDDHERPLAVDTFEGRDFYQKLWETLEYNVVDYYTRPAIPVLHHVPSRRELRKMYKL